MGKYKYILFDADDTLYDFSKAEQNALRATFSEFSIPFNDTAYKTYLMINHDLWKGFEQGMVEKKTIQTERFVRLFQTISCDFSGIDVSRVYQKYLSRQTVLLPFAKELCQNLYGRVDISIVTNGVAETQRDRFMRSEIRPFINHLIISEDIGFPKPDLRFFTKTFEIVGCRDLDEVLIIGDSLSSDIQGGINAGIDSCWFNMKKEPVPTDYRITHIIDDLRQIERIVFDN